MRLDECSPRRAGDGSEEEDHRGEVIGGVADRLTAMIAELSAHRPDPSDGSGWLNFEAALSDLHGALVALEEFGRGR